MPSPSLLASLDPRYPVSFLITLILVVGEARYGILGGYDRLVAALGVSTATELVLSRWLRGRVANVQSAYITGISLALLIKPPAHLLWPFALGGFLAIASKYVLQFRGRHPCFVALAGMRSMITGGPLLAEIAPLTGPMYQLFVFFMITDPKTTVRSVRGRIVVAAAVALVEAGIRLAGDLHVGALASLYPAPPILALAIVGPLAKAIDLYRETAPVKPVTESISTP